MSWNFSGKSWSRFDICYFSADHIECACNGLSVCFIDRHIQLHSLLFFVQACSTCQVYIDEDWFERVGAPDEAGFITHNLLFVLPSYSFDLLITAFCLTQYFVCAELDMIDLAHEPTDFSRLGCQVILKPELDGLRVTIPGGANNMFDDIPFQD